MKSDYERKKLKRCFCFGMFSFNLLFGIVAGWVTKSVTQTAFFLIIVMLGEMIAFFFLYQAFNQMLEKVEDLSFVMLAVVEGKEQLPEEEYLQGSMGILYTNFYKMYWKLKDSQKREQEEKTFLKDVISDISHQLKTPLASMNVFLDLLIEGKVSEQAKQQEMLIESKNQLGRMEWMVISMLKLARIEAGAITFEKKKTNLYELLCRAREAVLYLIREREQTICIDCNPESMLFCDGEWLAEAIINLLKNASDYSEVGKPIRMEVEQTAIYTRIYIKDEGMGIAEGELPKIFNRFYRVNHEVNPNSVGIGLSLSKSIVEGMGGKIHVNSELSRYTWFVITFVH